MRRTCQTESRFGLLACIVFLGCSDPIAPMTRDRLPSFNTGGATEVAVRSAAAGVAFVDDEPDQDQPDYAGEPIVNPTDSDQGERERAGDSPPPNRDYDSHSDDDAGGGHRVVGGQPSPRQLEPTLPDQGGSAHQPRAGGQASPPPAGGTAEPSVPGDITPPRPPEGSPVENCDHMAVLARNSCQTAGCHATPVAAGLDLTRNDLHQSLLNAPSQSPGCNDRLLIDPRRPERSLFLQAIGAVEAPGGDDDTCRVIMPPAGRMSPADRECLSAWVRQQAAENQPDDVDGSETPIHSALAKLKLLVHGAALTSEELASVVEAPGERQAIRRLLRNWLDTPEFEMKMHDFLGVALQQRFGVEQSDQFGRFRRHRSYTPRLRRVIEESFVRTAIGIIRRNEPFNTVAQTRTWMVTTANLVLLAFTDQTETERARSHRLFSQPEDAPRSLAQQISRRRWYIAHPEIGNCDVPQRDMLGVLMGSVRRSRCVDHQLERNVFSFPDGTLTEEDFTDWREVTFTYRANARADERIQFYDIRRLRQANEVVTRVPRVGFFTTSAFFQNWPTNVDNQFRVTTNQSLITALHLSFSTSDPTEPLSRDGLDEGHANQRACVGCHRHLDPMRVYFSKSYNVNYQRPFGDGDSERILEGLRPSFAFQGRRAQNQDLRRFGAQLARHPRFGKAWAQKICLYANSSRCDESDPEFVVTVDRFVDGGFNFRNLMIDLLSSHLITGRKPDANSEIDAPIVSITRQQHMCALFETRLSRPGICDVNRVANVIGLIPKDDFARGVVDPTQPVRPNPIYFAAVESVCEAVARTVVAGGNRPFTTNTPQRTLERLVSRLMSLPANHPRAPGVLLALTDFYQRAMDSGTNRIDALRSAFTIACMSPDVVGVGL